MDKPAPIKLRKWHFLFLGSALILLAAFQWYWNWRTIGLPQPLRPEHYMNLVTYVVGMGILGVFVYRLRKSQLTIFLVGLIIVILISALVTVWIYRTYPLFFELLRPMDIAEYDPVYVADWGRCFLTPVVYAVHIGLLVLFLESLVMFLVRQPGHEPG